MSQTGKIRILSIVCMVLVVVIACITIRESYVQRFFRSLNPEKPVPPDPTNNPVYNEQVAFTKLYRQPMKQDIAMLGTSLTRRVEWQELLGRERVINRGISGDITKGILNRVDEVISRSPAICFVEGGSNDIDLHIPVDEIVGNLRQAALKLRAAHIIPILFAVPQVSSLYPNYRAFNKTVNEVNTKLHALSKTENIVIIDLTGKIGDGQETYVRFTARDGMHLAPAVYELWADAVNQQLAANNL